MVQFRFVLVHFFFFSFQIIFFLNAGQQTVTTKDTSNKDDIRHLSILSLRNPILSGMNLRPSAEFFLNSALLWCEQNVFCQRVYAVIPPYSLKKHNNNIATRKLKSENLRVSKTCGDRQICLNHDCKSILILMQS